MPGELNKVADQARDLREWFSGLVRKHMGRGLIRQLSHPKSLEADIDCEAGERPVRVKSVGLALSGKLPVRPYEPTLGYAPPKEAMGQQETFRQLFDTLPIRAS